MLNYLEELLREKTNGKKDKVLLTQWELAKEYTTKVLATISNIFPHYTLHDRTHSEAILENINNILGRETFEKFSSTDLWLLLCAAFYHDTGMAVFASDLDEILKEENFLNYLKIQIDSKNTQASYFEISDNKINWKDRNLSLEKIEAFKYIVAEYIRSHHGERSKSVVEKDSFLNNSIPNRLKERLKEICECHTESLEKVMEIPSVENGCGGDYCHPRFIACLLRLGDLLDLDSDRISDIVLRTVKTIPAESSLHIKKHQSISHILINSEQIDISAKCEDIETLDLVGSWFNWLEEEIKNQTKYWGEIVPQNLNFLSLPKIGNLAVKLKDYDSPLDDGKTYTKFEIDSQKAIEMLQGANLYTEPFQSIRELLQNSVDATYLRIWVENKDSDITFDKFKEECQEEKYAIQIAIDKKFSDYENIVWHITISDSGIGMSKEDLKFLYKTGSSSQNKEKQRYLSEMPEWMKPSGTFGIGFQSIFLITDKVHIKTRKYNSGDEYDIDLYNPTGEDNGTILLKTIKNSDFKVGTEISFDLVEHLSDYDFFIESSYLNLGNDKLVNAIKEFAKASYQKIKLNGEYIVDNEKINFSYYSENTNLAVSIEMSNYDNKCRVFYRNQPVVETGSLDFHFLNVFVNILGGKAKDILTLNRNKINSQYFATLYKKTIIAVFEYLKENFSKMSEELKRYASAFVCLYKGIAGIKDDHSEIFNKWMEFTIDVEGKNQKLVDILKFGNIKIISDYFAEKTVLLKEKDYLVINLSQISSLERYLICDLLPQYFKSYAYYGLPNTCFLHKKENSYLFIEPWLHYLKIEGRIPCDFKYMKLAIKDDCRIHDIHSLFRIDISEIDPDNEYVNINFPSMVSPYINVEKLLELNLSEKLIDFVFENRKDESVTKDEIRATYQQFIEDRKFVIEKINNESNSSEKNE